MLLNDNETECDDCAGDFRTWTRFARFFLRFRSSSDVFREKESVTVRSIRRENKPPPSCCNIVFVKTRCSGPAIQRLALIYRPPDATPLLSVPTIISIICISAFILASLTPIFINLSSNFFFLGFLPPKSNFCAGTSPRWHYSIFV